MTRIDSKEAVKILDLGPNITQAMAAFFVNRLSSHTTDAIRKSGDSPVFKAAGGNVYLTYREWLVINTGSSELDFLDWAKTFEVIGELIQLKSTPYITQDLLGHTS